MAYAGMMLSLYFFVNSIHNNFDLKNFAWALLSGIMSIWANFSLLNYFLIAGGAFLGIQIFYGMQYSSHFMLRKTWLAAGTMLTSVLLLAALIYEPLRIILVRKQLFGGEQGFWSDTVNSLSQRLGYGADYSNIGMLFINLLIIGVLVASVYQILHVYRTRKPDPVDLSMAFVFVVLLGMVLASIFQFHVMGSFYPKERLAISFIPPFILLLLFLYKSYQANTETKPGIVKYILPGLATIFALHLFNSANFTYVLDWKYDANTKEIASDIEGIQGDILLGAHPLFEPALNFYRITVPLSKFQQLHNDGYRKEGEYDHYVIPEEDRQKIDAEGLMVIKEYFPSGTILARKEKGEGGGEG